MIRTVRRVQLLTVLALLLSGLLQPLAAAYGLTCAPPALVAEATQPVHDTATDLGSLGGPDASVIWLTGAHDHSTIPLPHASAASTAPCGVAGLLEQPAPLLDSPEARPLLSRDDLPPASALLQSLFRPPRLS